MKDKNILIVSCVFPPEPVVSANISYDLATELSKDYLVKVIAPPSSRPLGFSFKTIKRPKEAFEKITTKSYVCAKSQIIGRFYESYSFGKKVSKYIDTNHNQIDGVYQNSWPLLSQFLIVKTCKKYNIPIITHIQDIYPETLINKLPYLKSFFYKLLLPLDKYILAYSSTVITISGGMKDYLSKERKLSSDRVKVVFNWQKDQKQDNENHLSVKFTITYLGSLSPSAQIESIIQAVGELENPEITLVIAGSGSEETKLKSIADKYKNAVIQFRTAKPEDVAKIQSQADVLVLPLRNGVGKLALPSKLVSYMMSEKPILAIVELDCDTANIINTANCGWVVAQDHNEQLKQLISKLLTIDRAILLEKGKNSRTYAQQMLTKEVNLKRLSQLIMEKI